MSQICVQISDEVDVHKTPTDAGRRRRNYPDSSSGLPVRQRPVKKLLGAEWAWVGVHPIANLREFIDLA
jgi:hypothetical protein